MIQPFFTSKPIGQARPNGSSGRRTGLGLSLSYDIVKAHGGEIKVATNEVRTPAQSDHSDGDDPVGRGIGLPGEESGSLFIIMLPA